MGVRSEGGVGPGRRGQEGCGPEPRKGGGRRWEAQNFALFFLSPAGNFILSSLVFEAPRPSKTPPKFNEKTHQREKKMKMGRGESEKKSEILGGPAEGRSAGRKILKTPTKNLEDTHQKS